MLPRSIGQIGKADIERLVRDRVGEGLVLEFKESVPDNTPKSKIEFVADVTAFANTVGGDLVLGVTEERDGNGRPTGIPADAPGLSGNIGAEMLRLDSLIRQGTDPRLLTVQFREIQGFSGGSVLILRIPASSELHQVTLENVSRFYKRSGAGAKYQLDAREIEAEFAARRGRRERMQEFREERLRKIAAGDTPIRLAKHPMVVLHLIPLLTSASDAGIEVGQQASTLNQFRPLTVHDGYNPEPNFEGYVSYWPGFGYQERLSYVQIFHEGIIEAVDAYMVPAGQQTFPGQLTMPFIERVIIGALPDYGRLLRQLGCTSPLYAALSLLGVRGLCLPPSLAPLTARPIDRDVLTPEPVLIHDANEELDRTLKPMFDRIWQAGGYSGSRSYDSGGRWRPDRPG
jgi:hypothetical protein